MNREINYLPDTNLLFNFAELNIDTSTFKPWHKSAKLFWNTYGKETKIPSIVWAEFCGLWFHKNVNFEDYDKWFENRQSVFGLMYKKFKERDVTLCEESDILHQDIMGQAPTITTQKMPADLIKIIKSRIDKTIQGCEKSIKNNPDNSKAVDALERNQRMLTKGKILDGLDSVIAVFAYEYAKKNQEKKIMVVSDDKFMVNTIKYFYETRDKLSCYRIPENVSAILTRKLVHKKKISKK